MVKKASGKWCMCTDYTNLNKACPKDPYPLPSIDRLVDGALGSVFDYNQIKMHPQDEAKTSFIMDAKAYCYKVMSFRLKNAKATYQRMMDRMFRGMIGVDVVEVYVDDMVVKSTSATNHSKPWEECSKY
ncbi:hypothetical protein CR513_23782, partial [Mucuna pruriens]